jgi:hypothetical protein
LLIIEHVCPYALVLSLRILSLQKKEHYLVWISSFKNNNIILNKKEENDKELPWISHGRLVTHPIMVGSGSPKWTRCQALLQKILVFEVSQRSMNGHERLRKLLEKVCHNYYVLFKSIFLRNGSQYYSNLKRRHYPRVSITVLQSTLTPRTIVCFMWLFSFHFPQELKLSPASKGANFYSVQLVT